MFQYPNLSIEYKSAIGSLIVTIYPIAVYKILNTLKFITMKKLVILIISVASAMMFSQVRIGEKTITANPDISSSSVLLEFGDTKNKGIILPYVETVPQKDLLRQKAEHLFSMYLQLHSTK